MFRAMLTEQKDGRPKGDKEIPLVLADVSPEIFLSLLEFLYTNTCTLNSKNVSYDHFIVLCMYVTCGNSCLTTTPDLK